MLSGSRPSIPARRSIDAAGAERHDGLTRLRVHLLQQAVHREDDPLVASVLRFPVVEAAARHAVHVFANPQLLAGARVHGDERSVPAPPVGNAADDDRAAAGIAERIGPGDLKPGDVGLVDLARRQVARVVGTVAVPVHQISADDCARLTTVADPAASAATAARCRHRHSLCAILELLGERTPKYRRYRIDAASAPDEGPASGRRRRRSPSKTKPILRGKRHCRHCVTKDLP